MRSRTLLAATSLKLLFAAGRAVALECDPDALCPSDPCTITGVHRLNESCDLDFQNKDVTLASGGWLSWPLDGEGAITARNLTVRGRISSVGPSLSIDVEQDFIMERPGKLLARGKSDFYDGYNFQNTATVDVQAGWTVSLSGSTIRLQGSFASFGVEAAAITLNTKISVRTCSEDAAMIELSATQASIVSRRRLVARGCGPSGFGFVSMTAPGNISVEGPVKLTAGKEAGGGVGMTLEADGDIRLDKATVSSPTSGGTVDIQAGGSVLVGSIRAHGRGRGGYYGEGFGGEVSIGAGPTGTIRITRGIDASCGGTPCNAGEISLGGGTCYNDLTGATLRALPDGNIDRGCTCVHTDQDCDGGCILDGAKFAPPFTTSLPPCP